MYLVVSNLMDDKNNQNSSKYFGHISFNPTLRFISLHIFFFLSSAEQKKMELAEKYKQLKKSGKVEKYLMQKHKKNASKDRRHFPQSSGSSR